MLILFVHAEKLADILSKCLNRYNIPLFLKIEFGNINIFEKTYRNIIKLWDIV